MQPTIAGIETERVDDIPLLMAAISELGIAEIFNAILPEHGNWTGLPAGSVMAVWLAYILSTGDHRKSHLQDWVAARQDTLAHALGVAQIDELDFTDDRLSLILSKLSDDGAWQAGEQALNRRAIRVYKLQLGTVRLDTTTASSYASVSAEGLLQFGYSKDHRPDLGQVKIASATLDPLGMPLVTLTVGGARADDGLYIPLIQAAAPSLQDQSGLLYVGDSKMGARATRAFVAAQGDFYLMPLARTAQRQRQLADSLAQFDALPADQQQLETLHAPDETGTPQLIAQSFTVGVTQSDPRSGQDFEWHERRLVVRSEAFAQSQSERLEQQLAQAEAEVARLSQRRRGYSYPTSQAELRQRVDQLLQRSGCADYLRVTISTQHEEQHIRPYKDRPARTVIHVHFDLDISRQSVALDEARRLLGWRLYATNAPAADLPWSQAVEVYRDAHLHEYGYSRLKGKPLSLTPMYLQKEDQIVGLSRLLAVALRLLTLIEFVLRRQLVHEEAPLSGLYAGNKTRATRRSRTETLWAAFRGITLTTFQLDQQRWRHLTPLSETQQRILQLLNFPLSTYTDLALNSS